MITPELRQNIFYTVYFTVTHNALAIFYAAGIGAAIILSIVKPSRKSVILLLGFIVLLFSFEYSKHIEEGLKQQTLNSLITIQEHNQVRRIVNIVTSKLLPRGLPVLGWLMVGLSGYLYLKRSPRKPSGSA